MPFEPVILFFIPGLFAGVVRSDLKIPGVLYESLGMLLAIGLKGGVELARYALADLLAPALIVVLVTALIPLVAFPILHRFGGLARAMRPGRPAQISASRCCALSKWLVTSSSILKIAITRTREWSPFCLMSRFFDLRNSSPCPDRDYALKPYSSLTFNCIGETE